MKKIITDGVILLKDNYKFVYKIADIEYIEYENEEFEYIFIPNYSVIDLLDYDLFDGIPGLDLSLKKEKYTRKNIIPVFISERSPGKNRENLYELLHDCNMNYYNRLEWLKKTDTQYFGDSMYVRERSLEDDCQKIIAKSMFHLVKRSDSIHKKLLEIICRGQSLECDEITINDYNRKDYYRLLMPIYIKEYERRKEKINRGIALAKENHAYKGRKKIEREQSYILQIIEQYRQNKITAEEASKELRISRSTFFRRLKEL